jgi:site-specific DNA recombinase
MLQAILYARVSTSQQERDGTSIDSQLAALKAYAKKQKYSVLKTISESHTGADLWDRPGITQARELIRARKAQVLVCYAIDRLSRNPAHLLILLEEAERHGARIEFVTERMEDSPEWRLIQYVKSYAAELEREKIRERCVRGKKQRALSGKLHRSSTELYGYQRNHDLNRREIVEHEAAHVRRIFDMVIAGQSSRAICNTLNSAGVPPPSAGKRTFQDNRIAIWNPTTIQRIIRETSYCGRPIAWRWQAATKGKRLERPIAERIALPAEVCPPILSPDIWEAANAALRANRGTLTRNEKRFALLRGMITCARCGRAMVPEATGYRCTSRSLIARHCGNVSVARQKVERWIWESIEALIYDDSHPFVDRLAAAENSRKDSRGETRDARAEAQKRLDQIARGEQRILRLVAASDDVDFIRNAETQLRQLAADRSRVKSEIDSIAQTKIDQEQSVTQIEQLILWTLINSERPTTPEGQREILKLLGVTVSAEKGEWKVSLSLGARTSEHNTLVVGSQVQTIVIASRAA